MSLRSIYRSRRKRTLLWSPCLWRPSSSRTCWLPIASWRARCRPRSSLGSWYQLGCVSHYRSGLLYGRQLALCGGGAQHGKWNNERLRSCVEERGRQRGKELSRLVRNQRPILRKIRARSNPLLLLIEVDRLLAKIYRETVRSQMSSHHQQSPHDDCVPMTPDCQRESESHLRLTCSASCIAIIIACYPYNE